ncbi:hypothetical protein GCM10028818_28320 [Spirosoma horti]
MPTVTDIIDVVKSNPITKKWVYDPILKAIPASFFKFYEHRLVNWDSRAAITASSTDNAFINKVPNAGTIEDGLLVMHNGLKVLTSGLGGGLKTLTKNKGIHEPQEERVFQEVLKHMPKKATMIELGSNWAFYSMWFYSKVAEPTCFMIEPEKELLELGKNNFALNNMTGDFSNYFIGSQSQNGQPTPTTNIDDFIARKSIEFVDILHSDIQGFELEMLKGAQTLINARKVGYFFISTHSGQLHRDCEAFLLEHDFEIIASADVAHSYSIDGILIAKSIHYPGIGPIAISQR